MSPGTPRIYHRCRSCGRLREFRSTGRFRVNANGRLLDVWLLFRCTRCGSVWKLPLYQRVPRTRIAPETYRGFLENDPELARRYGTDRRLLQGSGARFHP